MAITKTNFMRGMQCPKMLWLDKHKPSLKVIPPEVQARLDAGNDFGDKAMGTFGPYSLLSFLKPTDLSVGYRNGGNVFCHLFCCFMCSIKKM